MNAQKRQKSNPFKALLLSNQHFICLCRFTAPLTSASLPPSVLIEKIPKHDPQLPADKKKRLATAPAHVSAVCDGSNLSNLEDA